ncbi:hypothetical protein [Helicobacter sp. T3_23-1056]
MGYVAFWRFWIFANVAMAKLAILCVAIIINGCAKYELESTQEYNANDSSLANQSKAPKSSNTSKSNTPAKTHSQEASKSTQKSTNKSNKTTNRLANQKMDSAKLGSNAPQKTYLKTESKNAKSSTEPSATKTPPTPQKPPKLESKNPSKMPLEPTNTPAKTTAKPTDKNPSSKVLNANNFNAKDFPPKDLPAPLPMQISYNELAKSSPRSDGNAILHLKKDNQQGFQLINIYDENGEILAMLSFKNKQLSGVSKIYKNGEVIKEVPYENGVLSGEVVSQVGKIRTTQMYKNSKKEGVSTTYRNGVVIGKKSYKNDILNGENLFFDAQNIAVKTPYINGRKNGNSSGYVGNNLVFLQRYVDDFLSGEAKTYGQNGILKISRFYKDGVLDGEEIVYDYPSQKPLHKALHKNGVLVSPYQNYDKEQVYFSIKPLDFANALSKDSSGGGEVWRYPSGQIAFEKRGNSIKIFHLNGALASEFEIQENGANGSTYNQNGVKESKISYLPHSHTQWLYNADGKTLRTKNEKQRGKNILQTYKNGILHKEIITIEGEDLTIYRVFFSGGGSVPKLQAELYEKDKKVVGGKRYDINGKVIFSYTFRSEDILFDEIFTYSAQARRAKILP